MMKTIPAIKTENLTKEFRTPIALKKIRALTDLSFEVRPGEIFGYLGPNGAGKTTTFTLLLGLIYPTRGKVYLWGQDHYHVELKSRIGFLPESPYFYSYLKANEFLHFCGQLLGMTSKKRDNRVALLLEMVGLKDQENRLIKTFSKGMLQRLGIAQALLNDPDLLILDEPMSGLDPLGRKEIKDIIFQMKERKKTIIFSTHILSDVETICDRVGLLINGRLKNYGPLEQLLKPKIKSFDISIRGLSKQAVHDLQGKGLFIIERGAETFINTDETTAYSLLPTLLTSGVDLISFTPRKETLEDLYVSEIKTTTKQPKL